MWGSKREAKIRGKVFISALRIDSGLKLLHLVVSLLGIGSTAIKAEFVSLKKEPSSIDLCIMAKKYCPKHPGGEIKFWGDPVPAQ